MEEKNCNINFIDYTLCNNKQGVISMLLNEGYHPQQIRKHGLYHTCMHLIREEGDVGINKIMMLHPDRDFFLSNESSFSSENSLGDDKENGWIPFDDRESVRTMTDIELEVERKNLKTISNNPPKETEVNQNKIQERLLEISHELNRRTRSALESLQKGGGILQKKSEGGLSINLKNEHLAIAAIALLVFFVLRKR